MNPNSYAAMSDDIPNVFRDCFAAQQTAYKANRNPSLQERRDDLQKLSQLMTDHKYELIAAVNQDYGTRSAFETQLTEILQVHDAVGAARKSLKKWMAPTKRAMDMMSYPLAKAWTFPQPVGVVGIVVPWNFPIAMTFQPLICAFAAGNRAMVKMSENSNALAALLQKILPAYFPADKLSIFEDAGHGPLFTQLPFNHLFFTGSAATGRAVMANAAKNLTPVTLELGGKSPCVVAPDYNLRKAAERIMWGKMLNAGQICTNVDYLFLPENKVDAFLQHACEVATQRYPDILNGDYTAIIDQRQYERIQSVLADAIAKGATAINLCPNQSGDATRRIMPPHAVLNVTDDMLIMQNEIFGPLLPIKTYRDRQDVVDYISDRPNPLAFYLFSNDRALQDFYLMNTLTGGVSLNETIIQAGLHNLPFGGVGQSGMGHYHGYEGFLTFSKIRPVFKQSPWRSIDMLMPPYKGKATKVLNMMFKLKS